MAIGRRGRSAPGRSLIASQRYMGYTEYRPRHSGLGTNLPAGDREDRAVCIHARPAASWNDATPNSLAETRL